MDDTDWTLISFEKPKKAEEPKRGVCSKCGKHIGKGLFRHMKKCEG